MNFAKPSKQSQAVRSRGRANQRWSQNTLPKQSRCGLSLRSTASAVLRGITEAVRAVPVSIWPVLFTIIAAVLFIQAFKSAMDLPTVYRSYATKQCEKVVNVDGSAGDCAKLPERYHNVWSY